MAGKVTRWTIARFHTVISVEALWAHFVAPVAHPTGITDALAIVLPTLGFVLAVALLVAIHSVETIRADLFAIGTGPSRRALTRSCFVRTFSTILTGARVLTLVSVGSRGARMLAGGPNIARSAGIFPGYMIACCIGHRTSFLASVSKEAIRTRFVTRWAGPTA